MTRRMPMIAWLVLVASACSGEAANAPATLASTSIPPEPVTTSSAPTTSPTKSLSTTTAPSVYVTVPKFNVDVDLLLEEGEVSASFAFESPNPATHFFDVHINFPVGTDLRVFIETASRGNLGIFVGLPDENCVSESVEVQCLVHMPILEGQSHGEWTGLVRKLSQAAADVGIEIIWMTEAAP